MITQLADLLEQAGQKEKSEWLRSMIKEGDADERVNPTSTRQSLEG